MRFTGTITAAALIALAPTMAWAISMNSAFSQIQSVPTMDEIGLIGLIVGVGVVAGVLIRRKDK
jgi:hypothetical protein